jgi:hydroxyacylglutathione hydrolase
MLLRQFVVRGLGHASYLVGSDSDHTAAVVDPRRDVEVYLEAAAEEELRITTVLETHIHNDYVSGARELVARTGADHYLSALAPVQYPVNPLADGDALALGEVELRAVETPGHTPDHLIFLAADLHRSPDPWLAFTGGMLLVGDVGRPDLLGGPEDAQKAAARLWNSLTRKIVPLADHVEVYPTHVAGSYCAAHIGNRFSSTIGFERRHNAAFQAPDSEAFVREQLRALPPVPHYYRRMRPTNLKGPPILRGLPSVPPLPPFAISSHVQEGAVLLDIRSPEAFGGVHIPGSINVGISDDLGMWVGWLFSPEQPIIFISEDHSHVTEAVRQLIRIGRDDFAGYLQGGIRAWAMDGRPLTDVRQMTVHELSQRQDEFTVLDVREEREWIAGHLRDALHVPLPSLPSRVPELDPRGQYATYCETGYRSSIAASFLRSAGLERVANVVGSMAAWRRSGLPLAH